MSDFATRDDVAALKRATETLSEFTMGPLREHIDGRVDWVERQVLTLVATLCAIGVIPEDQIEGVLRMIMYFDHAELSPEQEAALAAQTRNMLATRARQRAAEAAAMP